MATFLLAVLIVWFVLTLMCLAYDNAWAASVTLVLSLTVSALFYGFAASLLWLKALPITWFGGSVTILSYVAIGVLWSFFKFYRHVKKHKAHYKERGLREVDKTTIGTWIAYWPFSFIVYILGDLIREFVNWIVNQFQAIYKRIMDKALGE